MVPAHPYILVCVAFVVTCQTTLNEPKTSPDVNCLQTDWWLRLDWASVYTCLLQQR